MKKRYIAGIIAAVIIVIFFFSLIFGSDKDDISSKSNMPRIGQYLWTYNMNKREWHEYEPQRDDLESVEDIVLQLGYPEGNGGYTVYHLTTENQQIKKDNFWLGEGSQEFLRDKELYSYFPKVFEMYKVGFNGISFITEKMSIASIKELFDDYTIIKVSELQKGDITLKYSKNKKYMIINDKGDMFYKYYIIPNDSKKMQIEDFSNQFKVFAPVDITLLRIEGCSKMFPCYNIHIK